MEVLPLVTCHNVEVMGFAEVLHVLSVCVEREVVGVLLRPVVPSEVVVASRVLADFGGLLTCRNVGTEVNVQVQVFESVDRVVGFKVAHECLRGSSVILQLKQ